MNIIKIDDLSILKGIEALKGNFEIPEEIKLYIEMTNIFILTAMIFLHIVDDYVLQAPCLCDLKQKSFWEKHAPEEQYKKDYIVALIMHALSWSFMIMLPIAVIMNFNIGFGYIYFFLLNTVVHAFVDNMKANKKTINLWIDQTCHMIQIVGTFTIFVLGGL